jgi:phosphatidylserine/phosphatidylglycerophosphate/cardiolipin synthase-like enzyme
LAAFVALAGACNTAGLKAAPGNQAPDVPDDTSDGGGEPPADLDAIPTSSNVTIQVQPSDLGAEIEAAIRGATTSVHMTMYLLTDSAIIDALGDLRASGKDVKVVLNQVFPPDSSDNTTAFTKLKSRGVDVVYAPVAYTFTHAKTVVIDASKVLIMTMNLTASSARDNREYIATDADPADVADCEKLFAADFTNGAVSVDGKLIVSPQTASPVDPQTRLKALFDSAHTSLDIEVQSISDEGLTDAIIRAQQANVAVRVVVATGYELTAGEADAAAKMKAAGVPLVGLASPYIHAKAVVVDGSRVFVGSQNFTETALFDNREVGVVTDAPAEAAKVGEVIAQDFAAGTPL